MSQWVFINDDFVSEVNARIHFRDLAIQRGYGIFDFFKISGGIPLFLDHHLERFFYSATQMRLPIIKAKQELEEIIQQLISKNNITDAGIRMTVTGGYSTDGYSINQPNLIISQQGFQAPSKEQFQKGIKLITYEHQRQLPHVKSIDYLMAIWLQPLVLQQAADDVLYYQNGVVTECPRSNFFMITATGKIVTPKQDILNGVIRGRLLETLQNNFEIEERDIRLTELPKAAEAFITSTTKNILPVAFIDNHPIGTGSAGKLTKEIAEIFQTRLQQYAPSLK